MVLVTDFGGDKTEWVQEARASDGGWAEDGRAQRPPR